MTLNDLELHNDRRRSLSLRSLSLLFLICTKNIKYTIVYAYIMTGLQKQFGIRASQENIIL